MQPTFTILSTQAPLVEVGGDGPIWNLPGGVTVPDGAAVAVPVDLRNSSFRRFRVDAPATDSTSVVVTDSPYGAFVGVRRCVAAERANLGINRVVVTEGGVGDFALPHDAWPRFRDFLNRHVPALHALWNLYTDDVKPCEWRDVTTAQSHQVRARGGDLIVVHLVNPDEVRHA